MPRSRGRDAATSSFLIGNLHCPSCVSTIREVLQEACADHILWVSPNIVTSVVTVEHDAKASLRRMVTALADAGFEICGVTSSTGESIGDLVPLPSELSPSTDGLDTLPLDARVPSSSVPSPPSTSASWGFSPLSRWIAAPPRQDYRPSDRSDSQERILQAHLDNCEQCRLQKSLGHLSSATALPTEPTVEHTAVSSGIDTGYRQGRGAVQRGKAPGMSEKSFVTIEDSDAPASRPTWRASLAIGGMTCAVCVNTITDELKKRDWVSKVTVNLISNSGTVEVDEESQAAQVVEAIEDLGYDATLDSVVRVETPSAAAAAAAAAAATAAGHPPQTDGAHEDDHRRTVEIRIEGLYCEHCPDRIVHSLEGFRRTSLEILTKPNPRRPVLQLSYVPDAPVFTIRHILAAIEASDSALSASVYHPPTLEERSKLIRAKHQRQILYRVAFTGAACIPTFILGIVYMSLVPASNHGRMYLMDPWTSGISRGQIALFVLATPVYFFAADIFHVRAVKEIRTLWRRGSRTPLLQRFYRFGSMNTLISLGTTIAYVSSVSQMIAAAAYHDTETDDANFYFDSVIFLTFFLLVGRLIEAYSKSRTGDAVEMLGRLRPTTALLVDDGKTDSAVQADLLEYGDVVRVQHGASPPADGVVVQGQTTFDESSLTGESRLVAKTAGDAVYAGTVNEGAAVPVRVTGGAGKSMLDQIVAVVREGQTKRAPMEQIADLLTTYFVPVVTLVAVVTWVLWLGLGLGGHLPADYLDDMARSHGGGAGWIAFSLQFAIAVFVVACPCGLGLAAPTAIFVAGGMAARYGILAKGGGEAFEKASRVDCMVFDKTGTLTEGGEPTVTQSVVLDENKVVLAALQAVEANSSHPVAKAIVGFCGQTQTDSMDGRVDDLEEIAGRGMRATFRPAQGEALDVLVGNEALLADFGVAIPQAVTEKLQQWKSDAQSVALMAVRPVRPDDAWTLAAALAIADPVRPEAAAILAALQARGIRVYMLSGDNAVTAAAVARQLGIPADQVIAEVLPTEKAAQIQSLQASLPAPHRVSGRASVAMVGDGINDAPALTQADVAIAVGSGSDVAISSADFVLVQSHLQAVVTLLDLSRVVFRRIAFNFGWALIYNVLAVPIAAGVLYPIRTGGTSHIRLDPVWASLAMALSSISVVLSSLALRSRLPGIGFRPAVVDVRA